MKISKNYSLLVIILITITLFSSLSVFPAPSAAALTPLNAYDYVIFANATSTYAMNGTSGAIIYQNPNATALFVSIPQGTSWFVQTGTYLGLISINQSKTSITGSGVDSTIIKCPVGVYRNCIQAVGTTGSLLTGIYVGNLTVNGQWDFNATNAPVLPPGGPSERQQCGVSLQYVSNATVENVKAYNIPWDGIQAYQCQFVNYKYCIANQCFWHGLQFWSNTVHSTMDHCSVNSAAGGVTSEFGSNDNSITNIVASNIGFGKLGFGGTSGVLIGYNVHNIVVSNVQVSNSSIGINFYGNYDGGYSVYNVTLDHAQVSNCTEGLFFDNVTDRIAVSNSVISSSIWWNTYSLSSSNLVIFNCTFINAGIYLDNKSSSWKITDCTFQNSPISNYGKGTQFYVYSLRVSVVGSGSVLLNNTGPYNLSDVVLLTAVPSAGWSFSAWSGNLSGSANPAIITINGNKTVTATFTPNTYSITLSVSGQGSVSRNASEPYAYGQVVNLTAVPSAGWSFSAWSGNLSGSANPAIITINGNKTVTATFTPNTYSITLSVSGQGSVSRNASEPYAYGQVVNLTAVPSAGWSFSAWSGNLSGSANPAIITINGNKTVTATFTPNTYSITLSVSGQGSVSRNASEPYAYGQVVNLTAVPSAGWSFSAWSGNLSGSANPAIITINGNKTVTATFTPNTYSITLSVSGQGSVSRNASEPYAYGQVVNLTAVPSAGWVFTGWSGDLTGSVNPATLVITTNKTITATFTQSIYSISVAVLPSSAAGTVTPNMSAPYHFGDVVNLTESANGGYSFNSWSGDGVGSGVNRTVTVTGDMAVTANFTLEGVALTGFVLQSGGSGYTTPAIVLTGGGGSGATATARVSNGVIIGLVLTSPGAAYTSAPTVTIRDPSPRANGAAVTITTGN